MEPILLTGSATRKSPKRALEVLVSARYSKPRRTLNVGSWKVLAIKNRLVTYRTEAMCCWAHVKLDSPAWLASRTPASQAIRCNPILTARPLFSAELQGANRTAFAIYSSQQGPLVAYTQNRRPANCPLSGNSPFRIFSASCRLFRCRELRQ